MDTKASSLIVNVLKYTLTIGNVVKYTRASNRNVKSFYTQVLSKVYLQ